MASYPRGIEEDVELKGRARLTTQSINGDPAIQANSIGHVWCFLWLVRLFRILVVFARGPRGISNYFI